MLVRLFDTLPLMRIIAISGSLRAGSSNGALLRAAAALAPEGMEISIWEGLGELPHFNPDLDVAEPPPVVAEFRALLRAADGILISSPEYAHGVPGSLKNALDWLVSDGELVGKPVVLLNAAPLGGEYAQPQLLETLTVMSWKVLPEASILTPFVRRKIGADGEIAEAEVRERLRRSLELLAAGGRAG
jgi:chromate reductase